MSVSYAVREGVALIVIANAPVNSISAAVRTGIASALDKAQHDGNVVAIVLMGANGVFCGGAEVREFNTPFQLQKPTLPELNVLQDGLGKPLVAAIQGVALGGGLELALGCHWRIAHEDARLGLPEVTLGIMPGSGGSQRLPRLMGMTMALEMMVTGSSIDARTAYNNGLVDALADGDLEDAAVVFARTVAQREGGGIRRVRDLPVRSGDRALEEVKEFTRNHPVTAQSLGGVRHVFDACEAAATLPFDQGLALERQRFLQLLAGPEFKALSYAFFALRQARKVEGLGDPSGEITSVAFLGVDDATTKLEKALVRAGVRVAFGEESATADTSTTSSGSPVSGRQLKVIASRDSLVDAAPSLPDSLGQAQGGPVVATTSALSLLGKASTGEDRVIGLDTPRLDVGAGLLEVVRSPGSAPGPVSSVLQLARRLGCTTVVSTGIQGSIGQRMLRRYLQHAHVLLEEGCTPHQVDLAIEAWGMKQGPFALDDALGLDRGGSRGEERADPGIRQKLLQQGRWGRRTGAGWYRYRQGPSQREADLHVHELLTQHRDERGLRPRLVGNEEIVSRLTLALIQEAAELMAERATDRASNIDAVWLAGYGFPARLGGPVFHFRTLGLANALARMKVFAAGHRGEMWAPSAGLAHLADSKL